MKIVTCALFLLVSAQSFAVDSFSCFTNYTSTSLGMVEEKSFIINKKDSRIDSDGYVTSFNLNELLNGGDAKIEMNFGLGILNKNKILNVLFKPVYAENPKTGEKKISKVAIEIQGIRFSVNLTKGAASTIEFPVIFGKDDEKRIRFECGVDMLSSKDKFQETIKDISKINSSAKADDTNVSNQLWGTIKNTPQPTRDGNFSNGSSAFPK